MSPIPPPASGPGPAAPPPPPPSSAPPAGASGPRGAPGPDRFDGFGRPPPNQLQPGNAPPPFAPQALPPDTLAAYEKVLGEDADARKTGIKDLEAQAQTGNFAALDALSNLAGDPRRTAALGPNGQWARADAIQALQRSAGMLRPQDVQHLARALDNQSLVGRTASAALGEVARSGGPAAGDAAQALREKVYEEPGPTLEPQRGGGSAASRAADGLADAYGSPVFQQGDYRTLLKGAGFDDGKRAREALTTAAQQGDQAAIRELRGALKGQGGATDESRDMAARILSDAGLLTAADLPDLEKAAVKGDGFLSVGALKAMACGEKPVPGAIDALNRIAGSGVQTSGAAGSAFFDAYSHADQDTRSRHATTVLRAPGAPPEHLKGAIPLARERALKGDGDAISALEARFQAEGPRGFGGELAGALRDSAAKGNAGAADALGRLARLEGPKGELATAGLRGAALEGDGRSVEALASLAGSEKPAERARALPALGDVAAAAEKGSPHGQRALAALRGALETKGEGDQAGAKGGAWEAARELGKAASKLGQKELDALLAGVDPARPEVASEALSSLSEAVRKAPPGKERDQLISQVRAKIAERAGDLKGVDAAAVSSLLGADAKDPAAREGMARLLNESGDPQLKRIAATALSGPGVFEQLDPKLQSQVVNALGASGDVRAARSLLERNPAWSGSPMSEKKLGEIADAYNQALTGKIQGADKHSPLGKFGRLMAARQMAYDLNNPDKAQRNLAWNIDLPAVEKDLREVAQSKELLGACESVRQEVIKGYSGLAGEQEQYLTSEGFRRRLELTPAAERGELMQKELGKLGAVDPAAAARVKDHFMVQAAKEDVGEMARQIHDRPGGLEAHANALDHLSGELTGGKLGTKAAKNLAKALETVEKGLAKEADLGAKLLRNVQAEIRQLETAAEKGLLSKADALEQKGAWEKVRGWVAAADKRGVLSLVATGASLACLGHDVYENGLPKGLSDVRTWSALKDVTSAVGSAHSLSKLFVKDGIKDVTKLGKAIHFARWLGPVADLGGAGIDGYKAYKAATEADAGRTIGSGLSAAGGLASGVAGLAILAGCTGPAAPVTLVVGTAAIVGGMLINHFFGDSDETKFIKELGRDYGGSNDRYLYSYPRQPDTRSRLTVNGEPPPLFDR